MSQPPPAVFLPDGDTFVPTELARGPWDPAAQHGGAPAGLVARAVEAVPAEQPMHVARLTVELLRPVPLAPLSVESRVARPGRKVQLVEAAALAGGTPVVRAVALRIRAAELTLPEGVAPGGTPPGPEAGEPVVRTPPGAVEDTAFHTAAMEIRTVSGGFGQPGPATAWFRLRQPLVDGEEPSPVVRVAAAADFGNGISWVLPFDRYLFVNPDLTVHLHRPPGGEWVCLESRTFPGAAGAGMAESALYDRDGRIGRAVQSLIVEARPG